MQPLVNVYRGKQVESFHVGSVAVVDAHGRLLAYAGDPHQQTYIRSAAKPFQAIPLMMEGAPEEYDLTGEELALICASHGGEPQHVSTAGAILRKGDFNEDDLLCGTQIPFDEKAASDLRQSGEPPTALHNNCSGKHGGMLLATRLIDSPSSDYVAPNHPLQLQIRQTVAEFAGLSADEIALGTDGCGVPSYFMSLYRAAYGYARIGATARGAEEPAGLPRYADAAREIVEAMTAFPYFVAGAWSVTTPLMEAFGSGLVAKEGAEAFYAAAILPELMEELNERVQTDAPSIGIALKISDGSVQRARDPVILRTLELLGLDVTHSQLERYRRQSLVNVAGDIVGEVKAEFDLVYL